MIIYTTKNKYKMEGIRIKNCPFCRNTTRISSLDQNNIGE